MSGHKKKSGLFFLSLCDRMRPYPLGDTMIVATLGNAGGVDTEGS